MKWIRWPLLCAALALAGCASQRLVDSDVQSFSRLAALPATPTYRFERLPSQQVQDAQQSAIEAQATQAMSKVGLRFDATAPFYRAQVYARTERQLSPDWYDPGWGWGGLGWGGRGFYGGLSMRFPPSTLYRREVGLVLREAASGNVAYETHAVHEGLWSDDPAVFGAMFDAALSGFPLPPPGPRRINVEIPR
ncbi:hypothetical protein B2J88_46225 [Rhodococcus sp. SRB_17]|uniref:DUF4136 domain-containing protein n=1 Tax=Acidovorax sp. SRB_24 TaxID=1962700 RepID=UPI00145E72DB|nr:DUF4136 domain-containing protein [Acidovorax sp. SRB_24]NMM78458.1 hypothetical protein [Acidovorax sp. SRB_24]NMM78685.1 hypothetical protein [Acidovorax sp. SRB_24]NMM91610.1 hypothetical protein [Rhodococcus sp. SRB_17]